MRLLLRPLTTFFQAAGIVAVMKATPNKITDQPLWRLLVALHDAERTVGPDSESVELLREAVEAKLKQLRRRANNLRSDLSDATPGETRR
jgi:hypothetical protein